MACGVLPLDPPGYPSPPARDRPSSPGFAPGMPGKTRTWRNGSPAWSPEEDDILYNEVSRGTAFAVIAHHLRRSSAAVKNRWLKHVSRRPQGPPAAVQSP